MCCIYTKGNWFFIPSLSVLLGLTIIFTPIYIAKYKVFSKIKKYNDFISVAVDFLVLNIFLIVINAYTLTNGYSDRWWYLKIALPIVLYVYLALNIILSVRFLKINGLFKASIILFLINIFMYLPPLFIKVKNPEIQREIDDINIYNANLLSWQNGVMVEQNIHLIICLTLLLLSVVFLVVGLVCQNKRKKNKS